MSPATTPELSASAKQQLAASLITHLDQQSSRAQRAWGQIGRDAIDNAAGDIWEKIENGKFDSTRPLSHWLGAVFRNRVIDEGRTYQRRSRHEVATSPIADRHPTALTRAPARDNPEKESMKNETLQFPTTAFSDDDLQTVRTWALYDRVFLLCVTGLWNKVPPRLWDAWTLELKTEHGWPFSLLLSFLRAGETPQRRIAILAFELSVERNKFHQQWKRKHHLLHDLGCIQRITHEAHSA